MKNVMTLKVIIVCSFLLLECSCSQVAITGRNQLDIVPASTLNSLGAQSYNEFISGHKVSGNVQQANMVRTVGQRIQKAVEQYCSQNNLSDRIKGYKWEFNLVEDPSVNAFCLPGGKVVVYTGLIPVAKTETGLAVVMGHEIAHAIANHGGERMSQGLLVQMGGMGIEAAMSKQPTQTKNLFVQSYNAGTQYGVLLPYSRLHETEADHIGLIFMAMAGYNPGEAVSFWQRMAAASKGGKPPELLSTHPADATRIKNIEKFMPEAMRYYH